MRHFTLDLGTDRKFVVIEVRGSLMRLVQGKSDGISKRTEKDLGTEAEARLAAEKMAGELRARGFVEQVSGRDSAVEARPPVARAQAAARPVMTLRGGGGTATATPPPSPPTARRAESTGDGLDLATLAEADDAPVAPARVLTRLAPPPSAPAKAEAAPRPKKKAKKKKKAQGGAFEGLDKRVIAGIASICLTIVSFAGRVGYDIFLRPSSIVGYWEGSRLEHEKGRFLTHTEYRLILDGGKNAAMAHDNFTQTGKYAVQGNRLKLTFTDEEGDVSELEYRIALGRSTLDLFDPRTGDKVVELIRFRDKPAAVAAVKPKAAPKDLGAAPADAAADEKLAGVDFLSKDGAFRLKRPASWEVESGSRPDNTYSWARFTRDSAKVQVFADIAGSLMAGPNSGDHEEGSDLAPVHSAHVLYAKKAAEEVGDGYTESEPAPIRAVGMGEGRLATFEATGGGLFGSKVRGVRVTYLTNDRRISVICEAPASQFEKYQPTFLAMARSLAR